MDQPRKRALEIGLFIPPAEGAGGRTPRWQDLLLMAQRAEELGFDSLWLNDHLLFRFENLNVPVGQWECWSLLAALAAVTTRIKLGHLVVCTAFRSPALLAKMADTVDEISGGRLILGLGAGWNETEFHAFGYPFDHRVSRFEEAIEIIATLLRQGNIDFVGKYYQARDCELRPRGPRPDGPPILIGTTSARMLRLTAKYADIWNVWNCNDPKELPALRTAVDAACGEVGRDPNTLRRTATMLVDLPGWREQPGGKIIKAIRGTDPVAESPHALAERLRGYAEEGISEVQVWLEPSTLAGIESFAPVLDLLS